jgi:hypothetical protein
MMENPTKCDHCASKQLECTGKIGINDGVCDYCRIHALLCYRSPFRIYEQKHIMEPMDEIIKDLKSIKEINEELFIQSSKQNDHLKSIIESLDETIYTSDQSLNNLKASEYTRNNNKTIKKIASSIVVGLVMGGFGSLFGVIPALVCASIGGSVGSIIGNSI